MTNPGHATDTRAAIVLDFVSGRVYKIGDDGYEDALKRFNAIRKGVAYTSINALPPEAGPK